MPNLYARWMNRWENDLATRDTNRIVRPFEWGLEWLDGVTLNGDHRAAVDAYVRGSIADSDDFFSYRTPEDYELDGSHLTFSSPLVSRYADNNTVHAEFFPAANQRRRAVVVLPQWNADAQGHISLCKLLNKFGITALRMSMPYHDSRMPPELERADYIVSSNIGRTIHACRQAVIDTRCGLDWLAARGYDRLGVLGTSLGSCIAFIATAHDERVRAAVLNHVSMYFGDVVWTGLSTQHVRQGMNGHLTQEQLRECWAVISPASYLERLIGRDLNCLLVWTRYDTTFLPVYSRQVVEGFRRLRLAHHVLCLPCGHYTLGQAPFKYLDGLAMCVHLYNNL
jgi:hypothetical protein